MIVSSASSPLFDAAREIVTQARSAAAPAQVEQAVRACFPLALSAAPAEREALLDMLAPALDVPVLEHAVLVGYLCGALIEDGVPAASVEQPLVRRYLEFARRARKFYDALHAGSGSDVNDAQDEAQVARRLPEEYAAYQLLARAAAPGVAVMAASARARASGRALAELLLPLSATLPATRDIAALALVLDDAPYLALEPSSLTGIRGRMSGISENAQLQVLLMAAFPLSPAAPARVSEEAVQNARGFGPQNLRQTVSAAFTLHAWTAAQMHGLNNDEKHVLWNEARPASIPVFEGARVVLLGPPRYARSWAAQREFNRLRAELTVDALLNSDEVSAILLRMSEAERS